MPSLSINYLPAIGPLIQVVIMPAGTVLPASGSFSPQTFMALIDTGASHTCLTPKVVSQLGLTPISKQPVGGVHGSQPTNIYQFLVGIPFPTEPVNASGTVIANVVTFSVSGSEFVSLGSFDVLLGRDVICKGVFSMSFDGHAILSI